MGPRVDIRVLGPVQLLVDGRPLAVGGPKPRALLAMLTINRRRAVPAEALANALWNGEPPDAYSASLQVSVSNIRKSLRAEGIDAASMLRTVAPGYRLELADDDCDLGRFENARSRGDYAAALAEWGGAALADLRGIGFADDFTVAMDEERLLTTSARIDADIAGGGAASVVGELVALTADHPLREPLWGQLITALYLSGRQADALDAARRVRTILSDQLGIDPGPALAQLEQQVLRQEPLSLARPSRRAALAMNETVAETQNVVRRGQLRLADGTVVVVGADGLTLGRMTDNDVELDDPKVSRHHARITRSRAGILLSDLHSANGVYVNEQRIDGAAILADGDGVRIGTTVMVFEEVVR
ncbi:BTAD domain-containing putative transcriptional regulator [Antrihabitans cavernicola]|uniref:FHA domain-containing protein n=1 Tax=Antrihabitans cavernicola TaxID=2495913 RepID=A0A5A7S7P0_9NOCA|nr:BTAD domain-containing putative transcriptional regulator [Spelaeibacter cavernicola]KAA0019001.1 FHA domain-containing protein [Spelaeibacter cavernicola]